MAELAEALVELTPVGRLPVGTRARILVIRGGRELVRRLLGLGIRIGSEVDVLHRRGRGVVLASGDTRIALGGDIAEKLLAEPLPQAPPETERS
jgi:ferrous iron transport protein A